MLPPSCSTSAGLRHAASRSSGGRSRRSRAPLAGGLLPEEASSHDILDDFYEGALAKEKVLAGGLSDRSADGQEKLEEEQQDEEESSTGAPRAGPLARKMWQCALRGVRSEEVWSRFTQRVLMTSAMVGTADVVLMFLAYARIKYRDVKVLDTLSPFILRHIDSFSTMELVLLLNAHKKLEYERLDSIHLLLSIVSTRSEEWTGRHISLLSNAVAYFYIYQRSFWRLVFQLLPKLVWTMNPLELSNTVSAMARVDQRDGRALLMLARMCRRCALRHLFSQETLATSMNAFAKLDFNHPRLSRAFEVAAAAKLDRALAMGSDYRASSLRDIDVFDVQALVQVLHTLVCLVGAKDEVLEKLLTLVSWSRDELGNYQRRVLKTVLLVLRKQHAGLYERLPRDVKEALYIIEHKQTKVATFESRWVRELADVLRQMDIIIERKPAVDDQVIDIILPTSKAAVYAIGPYGFYSSTTHRTAYSKLHQRLLEMSGYTCMVVPYYEWAELKTEEDKMVYLWSLGRRAAAKDKEEKLSDAAPTVVQEDLQSDLSDLDAPSSKQAVI